jgi:hypothetical protein
LAGSGEYGSIDSRLTTAAKSVGTVAAMINKATDRRLATLAGDALPPSTKFSESFVKARKLVREA